uniref:Uncharacterized protein n=1 Tax=Panagrolaimus sp. ES5 TaxID=591445 RepID=A0AC34FML1_9BILA
MENEKEYSNIDFSINQEPTEMDFYIEDDMLIDESQIEDMIQNAVSKLGLTQKALQDLGININIKRQAIIPSRFEGLRIWSNPISYVFDSTIITTKLSNQLYVIFYDDCENAI